MGSWCGNNEVTAKVVRMDFLIVAGAPDWVNTRSPAPGDTISCITQTTTAGIIRFFLHGARDVGPRCVLHPSLDGQQLLLLAELDGHPELRSSSAERLLSRWRAHGDIASDLSEGAACARWSAGTQTLEALRSPFGLIPMWWTASARGVAVSSRQDTLRSDPQLNLKRLSSFLTWRGDDGGDDFFEGVQRIFPGARWSWRPTRGVRQRWWSGWGLDSIQPQPQSPRALTEALEEATASLLQDADALPTLSGGIDSSAVVIATLAHRARRPLPVASIVSTLLPSFDESAQLEQLTAALPISATRWSIDDSWPLAVPSRQQQHLWLGPQAHPGASFWVPFIDTLSRTFSHRNFLTGIGGDQLFGATYDDALRWWCQQRDWRAISQTARDRGLRSTARALARVALPRPWRERLRRQLPHPPTLPWRQPEQWTTSWSQALSRAPGAPGLAGPIPSAITWLQGWTWEEVVRVLHSVTRTTRARLWHPFLTRRMLAFSLSVPPDQRYREGLDKWLLRQTLRDRLPGTFTNRPKLKTFDAVVELGLGIKGFDALSTLFQDSRLHALGLIDAPAFLSVMSSYRRWLLPDFPTGPAAFSIYPWRTIAAELWLQAIDSA